MPINKNEDKNKLSPHVRDNFIKQIHEAQRRRVRATIAFVILVILLLAAIAYILTQIYR